MFILCDTSSILMLLRIAPDMFTDERFECTTIREVHDEIVRTTKFKSKYLWIRDIRPMLKPLKLPDELKPQETTLFNAISIIIRNGIINKKTGRFFDLSHEYLKIISHALTLAYRSVPEMVN